MFQLIYSSVEVEPFDPPALKQLLLLSRVRNKERGVTGMLIYDRGLFLQALEGDKAAVQIAFAKIERDTRHKDLNILFRNPHAEARSFGEWSMGFADAAHVPKLLSGVVPVNTDLRGSMLDRVTAVKILSAYASAA